MSAPPVLVSGSFFSAEHAREHLCDHVLTRPEAHDWSLVLPGYPALVGPSDDVRLTTVASSLFSPSPAAEGVEFLKAYQASLRQAIEDSVRLGWWWEEREGKYPLWHGLGLAGVYVIWDRQVVRTGYLPRSAEYPTGPPPDRLKNPLPRRRPEKRMPVVRPDTMEERYLLFHDNLLLIARKYENACADNAVHDWGSKVFAERPHRIGKWKQLVAERPVPLRSEESSQ